MQNPIQKFRQTSIVLEKPGILSEKLKILTSSNYRRLYYFLFKFCTRFLHTRVYKRVFGIFFILFRTWVICQNIKRPGFYTLTETRFINNSRSKQNKKNSEQPFVDIGKTETCAKFKQKISNPMLLELVKVFNFSGKQPLGNKRDLSKLSIGFCIT